MKNTNLLLPSTLVFAILFLGCGMMKNSNSANSNTTNSANQNKVERSVKPADLTFTAEDLGKEFYKNKASMDDLSKKYAGKIIAVTGEIQYITRKNRGSSSNTVSLYTEHLKNTAMEQMINCQFPDDDPGMELLEATDKVKIQGLFEGRAAGDYIPILKNCTVIEVNQAK